MQRREFFCGILGAAAATMLPRWNKTASAQEAQEANEPVLSFGVGGDYHVGVDSKNAHYSPPERIEAYFNRINEVFPDMFFHVGDLVYYSRLLGDFYQMTKNLVCPSVWVIGNHDFRGSGEEWVRSWEEYVPLPEGVQDVAFNRTCYWWEQAGWAFVVVDNNYTPREWRKMRKANKRVMPRIDWLEWVLTERISTPPERRLVFGHCPIDVHPVTKNFQPRVALARMKFLTSRYARYVYSGHAHINGFRHELGTTRNAIVGLTTVERPRDVLKKAPQNEVRAFLLVQLYENGEMVQNWVRVAPRPEFEVAGATEI